MWQIENDTNFESFTNHYCLLEMYESEGFNIPLSIVTNCRSKSDEYVDFVNNYVAPVVGEKQFENCCYQQHFSKFVSKSDEALALIIYENNCERWLSMAKAEDCSSSSVCPKYTTGDNASQTPKQV